MTLKEFATKYKKGLTYGAILGFIFWFYLMFLGTVNETLFYGGGIHYLILWIIGLQLQNQILLEIISLILLITFYSILGLILDIITYKNRKILTILIIILLILYALTIKGCHNLMTKGL